jgi:hypothetical protein
MATAIRLGRTLHATLCEVERGVFYVTYPSCNPGFDADELTRYHTGTSAADAKQRIERRAQDLGYAIVTWSDTITVPLFASGARIAQRQSQGTFVARRGA